MVDIVVPVSLFLMIFAIVYVIYTTRNKERMALIERGADPKLFKEYVEEVWREFEAYLADISDGGAELSERVVTVKPLGGR